MELQELIQTRRTVHNYLVEKVADEVVEEALRLSLWAPNHKLTYPWVYTWLGPETRAKLGQLNVELKSTKGELSEVKRKATQDNVTVPSHLISLGIKRSDAGSSRQHEDYATLASSVQIMALYLWEKGIATKWSTGGWSTHAKAYSIIGVDPELVSLEGCLMIGRAAVQPPVPERPGLDQFLRRLP